MQLSENGLKLIKQFEGLKLAPYLCQAGIPTIGYGCTYYPDGKVVSLKDKAITIEMADSMLLNVVKKFVDGVNRYVQVPINQNQFDALVSFAFNLGLGSLKSSTLLRKLNVGDYLGTATEFGKWVHAGGQVSAGLKKRREAERQLFMRG